MSQEDTQQIHPDALELAEILRPAWPIIDRKLQQSGVPLNEGDTTTADEGTNDTAAAAAAAAEVAAKTGDDKQQTFPREVVEELRRENAAARKQRQDLEAKVKSFEDRDKSDQEKAAEALKAAEAKAAALEVKVLRAEVAADKGVPAKLAKFLTGSTKEELESAADELVTELKGGNGRTSFDGGAREGQAPKGDMDSAIRGAAGRV